MSNIHIEVHAIQTLPPSNVNRDDTGSPKTATFGGVRRARVSSQAWKRAMRLHFAESLGKEDQGIRTMSTVERIAKAISEINPELSDEAAALASKALGATGIKIAKPKAKKEGVEPEFETTGYLLFVSQQQVNALAQLAVDAVANDEDVARKKKEAQALIKGKNSIDLALFGRMVADNADLNVDAAAQVAHALGVSRVENEFDYYTAMDDVKEQSGSEDAGAGMIGTIEFNSSTLYRYATVSAHLLQENLGSAEATRRAIALFIDAFVKSMPTGKQNTFANRTLPDGLVVTIRSDQPVSLVGAFENPIRTDSGASVAATAAKRLAAYKAELEEAYGNKPDLVLVQGVGAVGEELGAIGERLSLPELLAKVDNYLAEAIPTSED